MTTELFDIDALLNASMDDLEDLPPVGVPPSGHYNLTVSFDVKEVGDDKKQIPVATYTVDAVNELSDQDEASEVAVGQQFSEFFYLMKKDGERNTFGIGKLKQRLVPFAERFGTTNIGELLKNVQQIAITAEVKRKPNKKDEDRPNLDLKNVVLL